jgi:hypothetical protein
MGEILHWLYVATGLSDPSGPQYLFWSGFFGDLPLLAAGFIWYRHHKCAECLRYAHLEVQGTHYKTCHKHSTIDLHKRLRRQHLKDYPLQHELLNQRTED